MKVYNLGESIKNGFTLKTSKSAWSLCQALDKVNLCRRYLTLKDSSYFTSVLCLISVRTLWWSWQLNASSGLLTVSCPKRTDIQIWFSLPLCPHKSSQFPLRWGPDCFMFSDASMEEPSCSPDGLTSSTAWEAPQEEKAIIISFSKWREKMTWEGKLCKKIWMGDKTVFQSVVAIRIFFLEFFKIN